MTEKALQCKDKSYPNVNLSDDCLYSIVDIAKDYAIYTGVCMRSRDINFYDARVPLPFCLFPSPFPEVWFHFARDIQSDLNFVIHKVAHSSEFLYNCLQSTIETDDFVSHLWKIFKAVESHGPAQPVSLGLLRSDYMLNTDPSGAVVGLKQIENNTFASSFGSLSRKVSNLHSFVLKRLDSKDSISKLPENTSDSDFPDGLISAWHIYGNKNAAILFVVEDITYNICDQRALEFDILEINDEVKILRYTFSELRNTASLDDSRLLVNGVEIAVVYYRYGYSPAHYAGEEDWQLRLLMERSKAIKCPSVAYHLAGTKKVQLYLAQPGVVETFLPESSNAYRIREVFAEQHSLEMNEDGENAVSLGISKPLAYVLKPEREGGGNNIYGEEIATVLHSIREKEERSSYILMEKINPPLIQNCIVRSQTVPKLSDIICELGIYGVILGTKDEIFKNYQAGHVIRSKEFGIDEGGIVAGFGALDSPYLISEH